MKTSKYNYEITVAIEAVRRASKLTLNVLTMFDATMLTKQDKSPVTIADFGSQALICKTLKEKFPNDPVIGEESSTVLQEPDNIDTLNQVVKCVSKLAQVGSTQEVCNWIDHGSANYYSERFWTLDPIDGTKGFIRGDQYAVALALVVSGHPVAAIVGCPKLNNGIIFVSTIDCGTFKLPLNGYAMAGEQRVYVNDETDTTKIRYCESVELAHTSHSLSAQLFEKLGGTNKPIKMDSMAKYGIVASGDAEVYLRMPREGYVEKIWDHAPGQAIIEAAGGKVSDLDGKPLDYTCGRGFENNRGVIATNGLLHSDVLRAIEKLDTIPNISPTDLVKSDD